MSMFEDRNEPYMLSNQKLKERLGVDVHPIQKYTGMTKEQVMAEGKQWGPNALAGLREMYADQRKAKITGFDPQKVGAQGRFIPGENMDNNWQRGKVNLNNTTNLDGTPDYENRLNTVVHEGNHFGHWTGGNGGTKNNYFSQTELATRIRDNDVNDAQIDVGALNSHPMTYLVNQGGSRYGNWQDLRNNPGQVGKESGAVGKSSLKEYQDTLAFMNRTAKVNFNNNPANAGSTYTPFVPKNMGVGEPKRQIMSMSSDMRPTE
jgi:hypothetical protein